MNYWSARVTALSTLLRNAAIPRSLVLYSDIKSQDTTEVKRGMNSWHVFKIRTFTLCCLSFYCSALAGKKKKKKPKLLIIKRIAFYPVEAGRPCEMWKVCEGMKEITQSSRLPELIDSDGLSISFMRETLRLTIAIRFDMRWVKAISRVRQWIYRSVYVINAFSCAQGPPPSRTSKLQRLL